MCLPQVGEGVGGGIPLPHQGVFAFWGFRVSDLVYNFGGFVGIVSIQKVRTLTFTEYVNYFPSE